MDTRFVEFLILEQALRNARDHQARCSRRYEAAAVELAAAHQAVADLQIKIERCSDHFLARAA